MLPIVKPCGCPAESATVYEAEVMRRSIDRAVRIVGVRSPSAGGRTI